MRSQALLAVAGGVAALSSGVAWPLFAVLFGNAMDDLGFGRLDDKERLALSFLYLACGCAAASYVQNLCWLLLAHRKTAGLRERYLRSVLAQEVEYVARGPAGVLHELGEEAKAVQQALERMPVLLQHASTVVAGTAVAFSASWELALIMLATVPLGILCSSLVDRAQKRADARSSQQSKQASHEVHEAVSAISVVKAYSTQRYHAERYDTLAKAAQPPASMFVTSGALRGVMDASGQFLNTACLFFGALLISDGSRSGGAVAQVIIAAWATGHSFKTITNSIQVVLSGRQALQRLQHVISRRPAIPCDTDEGLVLPPAPGAFTIRFQHVAFAYPSRPAAPVLRGFTLDVTCASLGVVGRSGSGKSTVLALIQRFYDPSAGQVTVNGVPLQQLNLRWWRSQIGLVLQEPVLFAASVRDNIRLGRPAATEEEVEAAARAANAHGFISALPLGYAQDVGERGLQLSGGQKQRISLARAILKDPKVLLLDEATSALDTHSEQQVQQALAQLATADRTMVVVAHRLSTIRGMERIAVVHEGAVVEQGTHEQLASLPAGAYAQLMAMASQAEARATSEPSSSSSTREEKAALEDGALLTSPGSNTSAVVVLELHPVGVEEKAHAAVEEKAHAAALPEASDAKANAQQDAQQEQEQAGDVDVPFSRLLRLSRPEWGLGLAGLAACAVQGVRHGGAGIIVAYFLASLYTTLPSELTSEATFWARLLFITGIVAFLATFMQLSVFGLIGARLATRVRSMVFSSILNKQMAWFDDPRHSSAKLTAMLESVSHIRGAVGDVLGLYLDTACNLLFAITLAFVFSWRTALLVLGVLPLLVAGTVLFHRAASSGTGDVDADATQHAFDAISAVQLVQAFVAQDHVMERFHQLSRAGRQRARRVAHLQGAAQAFSQFAILGAYGLFLWFGAVELESQRATVEQFLASLFVLQWAVMGLAIAQVLFPDVAKAKPVVQRVFQILDEAPELEAIRLHGAAGDEAEADTTPVDPYACCPGAASVRLEAVVMSYPMRPSVLSLRGVSLGAPAGSSLALVGESGGGKTSVVRLLMALYQPHAGRVLVNGVDVRRCDVDALRAGMGYVSQQPLLVSASVRDNIAYGAQGATAEQVERAARAAHIHNFILTLPQGYDTQVHGGMLSGGQRQRVALARAVLRAPRVLLLDEATSALDSASEAAVQAALEDVMARRSCTTLMVAHRLATVRGAGSIAVLQQGRVAEQGTHDELMAVPGGVYASMVHQQMRNPCGSGSA